MATRTPSTAQSRVPQHLYADPGDAEYADHRGLKPCAVCHVLGRAGDARHTLPPPPKTLPPALAAAYRARDLAITGERED